MKDSLIASNDQMLYLIEDLLKEGKTVRLKIKGSSMNPFLKEDLTQVDLSVPLDKEIVPGAMVLFKIGKGFILHRVIKRKENQLLIRGDNLFQSEEYVTIRDVIGIVRKIIYSSGTEIQTASIQWRIMSSCWLLVKPLLKKILLVKNSFKNH